MYNKNIGVDDRRGRSDGDCFAVVDVVVKEPAWAKQFN